MPNGNDPTESIAEARIAACMSEKDVAGLVGLFDEPLKPEERQRAIDALFSLASPEAFEALGAVAAGEDMGFNPEIIRRLAGSPHDAALRGLGRVLQSADAFRRSEAARALGRHEEPAALVYLLRAARDPKPYIARVAERVLVDRICAMPGLLAGLPAATVDGILGFLEIDAINDLLLPDFPVPVREAAARRLGSVGGPEAGQVLVDLCNDAEEGVREAAWSALESASDVPVHALLPLLVDGNSESRLRAVPIFGRGAGADGLLMLIGLAADRDARIREAAIRSLGSVYGDEALIPLAQALSDAEDCVRLAALTALARIPDTDDLLVRAAVENGGEIRQRACMSLAKRGVLRPEIAPACAEILLAGARDDLTEEPVIDGLADIAGLLGQARAPAGLPGLIAVGTTNSRRLRRTAVTAILNYADPERLDALADLAETRDRAVLKPVAQALGEVTDPRGLVPLIRSIDECGGRMAKTAQDLLRAYEDLRQPDRLLELLRNAWVSVRRYAARALRSITDAAIIAPLLETSLDPDVEVQLACIEALARFAADHPEVVERLVSRVTEGDVLVRQAAVEALGQARIVEAVPVLIRALGNIFLRPRAEEALRTIGDRRGWLAIKRRRIREKLFVKKPKKDRAFGTREGTAGARRAG